MTYQSVFVVESCGVEELHEHTRIALLRHGRGLVVGDADRGES